MGVERRNREPARERPTNIDGGWRLFLAVGAVLMVLGIAAVVGAEQLRSGLGTIALLVPFATVAAVSFLFGVILLLGGTVLTATAFGAREWPGSRVQVLLAAVYTVFGLALLVNPLAGVTSFTALLLGFFFIAGLLEMDIGFRTHPEMGWLWLVLSGVVALLAGGVVLFAPPVGALFAVSVAFGVTLFATGISLVVAAVGGRKAARERTPAPSPETARH